MSIQSILEGSWGIGAGVTLISQIPFGIGTEYTKAYAVTMIVVTGLGILFARIVDAVLKYRKGMATTDTGKLLLCIDEKTLIKEHFENIIKLKDEVNSQLTHTISQLQQINQNTINHSTKMEPKNE